jgi:hypothetical protein
VTLRHVFAGTTLSAIAIALVVGGVFAWQTSDSARGAALVGTNGFEVSFQPVCDDVLAEPYLDTEEVAERNTDILCHTIIGPNGSRTKVGEGFGTNTGEFDLVVTGGYVDIRLLQRIDPLPIDPAAVGDVTACRPDNFGGSVEILGEQLIPPGETGGKFAVALSVDDGAPEDCQGQLVYYRVVVEAENP